MATTALAVQEKKAALAVAPRMNRAIILKDALAEASEQRALLKEFVEKHMRLGTDYGPIPGAGEQKVLLKPGAEKLVELFRCTPKFHLLTREEKWEGNGFFNYMFRARILSRDAQEVLAEGYGSANSNESKHRWRNASRKCPSCGKDAIIQGKAEYGGGWLCFKKKGGCNAKFLEADPSITSQVVGKVENTDAADLANTVLKMAKKRALVDAAIALARCSDMFTQDLDDDVEHPPAAPASHQHQAPQAPPPEEADYYASMEQQQAPAASAPTNVPAATKASAPATPRQEAPTQPQRAQQSTPGQRKQRAWRLWTTMKAGGADVEAFRDWCAEVLGHRKEQKDWTDEDLDKLETSAHQDASR
jgi:hypothetical protein